MAKIFFDVARFFILGNMLDKDTIVYGLIGRKLGHSFSARYFNDKFRKERIDCNYRLFEMADLYVEFPKLLKTLQELRGLNVTIPYKKEMLSLITTLTPEAESIGAVNTIRIERGADNILLHGHNTDASGFSEAIRPLIRNRKAALVLGQGGAAKAVIYALKKIGISITKVSRKSGPDTINYDDLTPRVMELHDIIVNCTPLGMWPDTSDCPDIPYYLINSSYLCFDLVYNPESTEFMRRCAAHGAEVSNGLRMLYNQADESYRFWNTVEYNVPDFKGDFSRVNKSLFLSREVVVNHNNMKDNYWLSYIEILTDESDNIVTVKVYPYEKEEPSAEYSDTPIVVTLGAPLQLH